MTKSETWKRVWSTNQTNSSGFAAIADPTTEPAESQTTGIIRRGDGYLPSVNDFQLIVPVGVGSNNGTGSVQCYGIFPMPTGWLALPLCEVAATFCQDVGTGSNSVPSTERYADTFTLTVGDTARVQLFTGFTDQKGGFILDCMGARFLQFQTRVTGSMTNMNIMTGGL